jgi:hypothetical protein
VADPISFAVGLTRLTPPWLRRRVGHAVMRAFGSQIDTMRDGLVEGVKLRFPGWDPDNIDEAALALIGRERRFRRGPGETSATYAQRLLRWWDAHRRRGSPYELLRQLSEVFFSSLAVRIDIVAQSGLRHWIAEDVEYTDDELVTRDAVTWDGDGSGDWAHVWVFFYLGDGLPAEIATELEDLIVDDSGNTITGNLLSGGEVSDELAELFKAIPREWSAAHIPYVTVVLLYSTARLWNYPQPVPTWVAWGASGATWGGPVPVILIAEA